MHDDWLRLAVMFLPKAILLGALVWYTLKLRADVRRARGD